MSRFAEDALTDVMQVLIFCIAGCVMACLAFACNQRLKSIFLQTKVSVDLLMSLPHLLMDIANTAVISHL